MPRPKKKTDPAPVQVAPLDEEVSADSSLVSINIRLPQSMLSALRDHAERIGIGYQALMKVYIDAGLRRDG